MTICVVDDEAAIRRLLHAGLARAGYRVVEASNAREALNALHIDKPELVLLDLGLHDRDELELIMILKSAGVSVIVVSARDATEQKVAALDLGADDYVSKPFDSEEVLARIRTALRHRLSTETGAPLVRSGDIEIDLVARQVRKGGGEVHLHARSISSLNLPSAPARRHPCRELLKAVWGPGRRSRNVEYLRVTARGIRRKLEDDPSQPTMLERNPASLRSAPA